MFQFVDEIMITPLKLFSSTYVSTDKIPRLGAQNFLKRYEQYQKSGKSYILERKYL